MPELDRFERTFQAGWRAAYQHAREGVASDEEIGDKLVKTLAKTLRESDGVPGLPAMVAMVLTSLVGPLMPEACEPRGTRRRSTLPAAYLKKSCLPLEPEFQHDPNP